MTRNVCENVDDSADVVPCQLLELGVLLGRDIPRQPLVVFVPLPGREHHGEQLIGVGGTKPGGVLLDSFLVHCDDGDPHVAVVHSEILRQLAIEAVIQKH